MAKKSRP